MNSVDEEIFSRDLDYDDFAASYFAPRRVLIALNGEFSGLIAQRDTLGMSFLAQIDAGSSALASGSSAATAKLHSQYITAKYLLPFKNRFEVNLDGAVVALENSGGPALAFAASAEAAWLPPTAIPDRLSLAFRWASGQTNNVVSAFVPVSGVAQGSVLKARLSGISVISGAYTARFHRSFTADFSARYFLRNDDASFKDPELGSGLSPLLGFESYASLSFVPLPDLSLSLGAGVFLPGAAFKPGTKPRWIITAGSLLSF
jgi:hypothetical protein